MKVLVFVDIVLMIAGVYTMTDLHSIVFDRKCYCFGFH